MTLIDNIEFYGRAVDAGDIPRDQAINLLVRDTHGALTHYGAAEAIDNWTTRRAEYQAILDSTLNRIHQLGPHDTDH